MATRLEAISSEWPRVPLIPTNDEAALSFAQDVARVTSPGVGGLTQSEGRGFRLSQKFSVA